MPSQLLSLLIWVPFLAGVLLLILPIRTVASGKLLAIMASLFTSGLALGLLSKFNSGTANFQFVEKARWMPSLGISYHLGVDGISVWMVVLSALLGSLALAVARPAHGEKSFYALLLMMTSTMIGVFSALDLVLFYILFELSLVPVTLLILNWGSGDRQKAAMKYLGVLFAGSLLLLVGIAIIGIYAQRVTGTLTFSIIDLQNFAANQGLWNNAQGLQAAVLGMFLLAFLVKSPVVPVHTWLPATYESAPIPAIIGGVALKVGTYGIMRFCLPLFPQVCAQISPILVAVGVIGILYGGAVAIVQTNIHRLMAYSTISHVGFIIVGTFSLTHAGLMGASFQQANHGIASAGIFALLAFLQTRQSSTDLRDFGGLKARMPILAGLFLVAVLCNLGLPLTSGFVGEFLALMGAFQAGWAGQNGANVYVAALAGAGAVLAASYMLVAMMRLFYGAENRSGPARVSDLNLKEFAIGGVVCLVILGLGIFPSPVLRRMEPSVLSTHAMGKIGSTTTWQPDNLSNPETAGRTMRYPSKQGLVESSIYPVKAPDLEREEDRL